MPRVLVIDDDLLVGTLLKEHLSNEGFSVQHVTFGEEGILTAQANPPQLIFLDVNLPDATGFQICGRLRQMPETKSVPIIMMTGAARSLSQQSIGRQMGANDYVLKPFDIEVVTQKAHALLGTTPPSVVHDELPLETPAPVPPPPTSTRPEEPRLPSDATAPPAPWLSAPSTTAPGPMVSATPSPASSITPETPTTAFPVEGFDFSALTVDSISPRKEEPSPLSNSPSVNDLPSLDVVSFMPFEKNSERPAETPPVSEPRPSSEPSKSRPDAGTLKELLKTLDIETASETKSEAAEQPTPRADAIKISPVSKTVTEPSNEEMPILEKRHDVKLEPLELFTPEPEIEDVEEPELVSLEPAASVPEERLPLAETTIEPPDRLDTLDSHRAHDEPTAQAPLDEESVRDQPVIRYEPARASLEPALPEVAEERRERLAAAAPELATEGPLGAFFHNGARLGATLIALHVIIVVVSEVMARATISELIRGLALSVGGWSMLLGFLVGAASIFQIRLSAPEAVTVLGRGAIPMLIKAAIGLWDMKANTVTYQQLIGNTAVIPPSTFWLRPLDLFQWMTLVIMGLALTSKPGGSPKRSIVTVAFLAVVWSFFGRGYFRPF